MVTVTIDANWLPFHDPLHEAEDGEVGASRRTIDREITDDGYIDIEQVMIRMRQRLGASPQLARQCGIAVYEAEMNLIIHSTNGGVLRVQVEPHRILMQTTDDGPGIADVKQALQPGWSTASELARSMGFGAGMGLVNIQRCVDKMEVESTPGKGTKLLMEIHLRPDEKFKSPPDSPESSGV